MHLRTTIARIALAGMLLVSAAAASAQQGVAGNPGVGDDLFPLSGNGGYDVQHYTLDVAWSEDNTIEASAEISAIATLDLSSFNLDFIGFDISELTVNGEAADYARDGGELTITPAQVLGRDDAFTVLVRYAGTPTPVTEGGIAEYTSGGIGWNAYPGGVITVSQTNGSPGWYPVNDHPTDAATYTMRITVPAAYTVAANGLLSDVTESGETRTFLWEATDPMASYLVTVNIGMFTMEQTEGPGGLPIINFFPEDLPEENRRALDLQGEMIAFLSDLFGPYPFASAGAIVHDIQLGFALETQTRPVYGTDTAFEKVVLHELAHQWFGDSVRLSDWQDIWLNEGFASYAEALWAEHTGGQAALENAARSAYSTGVLNVLQPFYGDEISARLIPNLRQLPPPAPDKGLTREQIATLATALAGQPIEPERMAAATAGLAEDGLGLADTAEVISQLNLDRAVLSLDAVQLLNDYAVLTGNQPIFEIPDGVRTTPPRVVNSDNMFNLGVYQRGAATLHALRLLVGDEAFFSILRTYYQRYSGETVNTTDFISVAEEISDRQLDAFFDAWLYAEQAPDIPELGLYANAPALALPDSSSQP